MLTLGIESSCDETAAAIVRDGSEILSNVIHTQIPVHAKYGGVVPELASRAHVMAVLPMLRTALEEAKVTPDQLDLVAVTFGPGLVGSLLVGLESAKIFAWVHDLPMIGVNHIEGHLLSPFVDSELSSDLQFPYVALVVSGGHTSLFHVQDIGNYTCLGRTLDDAAGEAFDKVSKRLGGGYPGGPWIERMAAKGDPERYPMPRPMYGRGLNFSFSGLKTAAATAASKLEAEPTNQDWVPDLCASTQTAIVSVLLHKAFKACADKGVTRLVICGGVACNGNLREAATKHGATNGVRVFVPQRSLCTDNAAMIACAGSRRGLALVGHGFNQHHLDVDPSLSLDETT